VNRAEKDAYKRDYAAAKKDGKPFFPYAVYKDILVATLVIGIVIALAIWQKVTVGPPVNPATTDFVPRPEWYFFFLFELLRIFKGQNALMPVLMATFIVPNILLLLLIVTPLVDRGPERRIWRRPIALFTSVIVTFFLAFLTYKGATAPEPAAGGELPQLAGLDTNAKAGLALWGANCTSCHTIKNVGGAVGPNLTNEGAKNRGIDWHIRHLKDPKSETPGSAMPPFTSFTPQEYQDLATLLNGLGTKYK
jgi:quinol---cytochrome c reductase cytochrome c subunit, bacillus type